MKRWTILAVAAALGFYWLALSNSIYELTSPSALSIHVVLRKLYSVGAFTALGFLYAKVVGEWRSRPPSLGHATAAIALYSAAIELGQRHAGSHEGRYFMLFDVLCGALGGFLGGLAAQRFSL